MVTYFSGPHRTMEKLGMVQSGLTMSLDQREKGFIPLAQTLMALRLPRGSTFAQRAQKFMVRFRQTAVGVGRTICWSIRHRAGPCANVAIQLWRSIAQVMFGSYSETLWMVREICTSQNRPIAANRLEFHKSSAVELGK